jgi:hypothetical protein
MVNAGWMRLWPPYAQDPCFCSCSRCLYAAAVTSLGVCCNAQCFLFLYTGLAGYSGGLVDGGAGFTSMLHARFALCVSCAAGAVSCAVEVLRSRWSLCKVLLAIAMQPID